MLHHMSMEKQTILELRAQYIVTEWLDPVAEILVAGVDHATVLRALWDQLIALWNQPETQFYRCQYRCIVLFLNQIYRADKPNSLFALFSIVSIPDSRWISAPAGGIDIHIRKAYVLLTKTGFYIFLCLREEAMFIILSKKLKNWPMRKAESAMKQCMAAAFFGYRFWK